MPLGVGIWTVLGFLAVPSDRFISHVFYVVVVCFPVTGSALAVAGRETSAISITFICAGLRPLFHLEHFEEEVGVRGTGFLDFLAETGTGRTPDTATLPTCPIPTTTQMETSSFPRTAVCVPRRISGLRTAAVQPRLSRVRPCPMCGVTAVTWRKIRFMP